MVLLWEQNSTCKVKWKSLSHVQLFATPWTVAQQTPLSVEFSRQEYWRGLQNFYRESSQLKDWTQVSCTAGRLFTIWATREDCQYL